MSISSPPRKIMRQSKIQEFCSKNLTSSEGISSMAASETLLKASCTLTGDANPGSSEASEGLAGKASLVFQQTEKITCESPDMFASSQSDTETLSEIKIHNTFESTVFEANVITETTYSAQRRKTIEEMTKFDEKNQEIFPVEPSRNHKVLFEVPIQPGEKPKPFPLQQFDRWDNEHVRMPCSSHNLYPVEENNVVLSASNFHINNAGNSVLKKRWSLIQSAFERPIETCHQLEQAILSYNNRYSDKWDFSGLLHLVENMMTADERKKFFNSTLPGIVELALRLPLEITTSIPLLVRQKMSSLTLSQLQIACVLANGFLCTFPRRNTQKKKSEFSTFPDINFVRLFENKSKAPQIYEKLKCLLHYFERVSEKEPTGVVTFTRQVIPEPDLPDWQTIDKKLHDVCFVADGTIEKQGAGLLQIDFANKYIGGGVLGWGCVQEEIRFIICPELIAACLFTESSERNEAIVITGCEQYCSYSGYAHSFKYLGDYQDLTPVDVFGRKRTTVVAMDAARFHFSRVQTQYQKDFLTRELNKAYVGFHCPRLPVVTQISLAAVATGNWGCGVYRGDPRLKCLLQSMAASLAGRDMAYFTFFDQKLQEDLERMHLFLKERNLTIGKVYDLLCQYGENYAEKEELDLYGFLYAYIDAESNDDSP